MGHTLHRVGSIKTPAACVPEEITIMACGTTWSEALVDARLYSSTLSCLRKSGINWSCRPCFAACMMSCDRHINVLSYAHEGGHAHGWGMRRVRLSIYPATIPATLTHSLLLAYRRCTMLGMMPFMRDPCFVTIKLDPMNHSCSDICSTASPMEWPIVLRVSGPLKGARVYHTDQRASAFMKAASRVTLPW